MLVDLTKRKRITLISISSASRVRTSTCTRKISLLCTSKLIPHLYNFFLNLQLFWGKIMWSFSRDQTLQVYFLISLYQCFLSCGWNLGAKIFFLMFNGCSVECSGQFHRAKLLRCQKLCCNYDWVWILILHCFFNSWGKDRCYLATAKVASDVLYVNTCGPEEKEIHLDWSRNYHNGKKC